MLYCCQKMMCYLCVYFSGVRLYSSVTEQKLLDHNYNGLKRWKYEIEGSLSKHGLGSFQQVLNKFQTTSSNGMARSSLPNEQDETFAQHFQYFSKVMVKSITCYAAQKMNFSIQIFFSECEQIHRKLRICSPNKTLMENFIFVLC